MNTAFSSFRSGLTGGSDSHELVACMLGRVAHANTLELQTVIDLLTQHHDLCKGNLYDLRRMSIRLGVSTRSLLRMFRSYPNNEWEAVKTASHSSCNPSSMALWI
ncbi:hypothetical protein [Deinococcus navajonensis]|uniref:Uncharacterized protein n=1 Tax=Deinococcus navajonensis TaxID=309884 RepID=A0ABV8XH33_9DEIO